jgi:hypothetical protein
MSPGFIADLKSCLGFSNSLLLIELPLLFLSIQTTASSARKMDTKVQPIVHDEKSNKHYEEEHVKPGVLESADYTGAQAKTDPAEIALVKKIDWRLMPTLCTMYL